MATLTNFFRKAPVPSLIQLLDFNTNKHSVTLKSTDSPYYAVRSLNEKATEANPLETPFGDPFKDVVDTRSYAKLILGEGVDPQTRKEVLEEIAYLRRLRLVKDGEDPNTYYVSSLASFLYGEQGLFASNKGERSPSLKSLVTLLVTYTLPGYYWQSYYAKPYLPTTISITGKLQTTMTEIESTWNELRGFFDRPLQENA